MNIKTTFLCYFLFFLGISFIHAQTPNWNPNMLGTCSATCSANNIPSSNPKGGGNNTINNGNGTIATTYTASACGLNYTIGGVKTGKRYFPAGPNQPAGIVITGIPPCRTILKAFLYTGGSGNGIAFSSTLVNPALTSSVFPMTPIGNHIDKCWGYAGTYNYRADVTALVTGNGTYSVSGIPTSITTPGNDMDGASLVIIYTDPTQNYTGNILIGDGCQVNASTFGILANTLTGFNACANSTFAQCFYIISDLQNILATGLQMNNAAYNFSYPAASNQWWDNIVGPATPVTAGQSSCLFGATNTADCYNIVTEGLYYQTACLPCAVIPLSVTTATTSSCTVGSATAFATGGTGPYTYSWTPTAATTSVISSVPTGNYTVTVKDATGCTTITAIAVIPATSSTITATSATVCPGFGATLNAGGASTYTWQPGNIIGPSASFTPAATTVYTVTGTSAGGCTASTTGTITVNPSPVVLPTSNSPVCSGGAINLTVGAAASYTWAGPNAFASNAQNPTINNAQNVNAGNYTVTVTSALGCTASAVVNVIVNSTPTITPTNTGPYCSGTNIILSVAAAASYTWSGPNAFASNAQNPVIPNAQAVNAGNYTVTVTAVGGCMSTGTTNVIVNPTPTITVNSGTVCLGNGATLNAAGANTYTWQPGNINASSVTFFPLVTTVYTITGTSASGCTSTANATITVNPLPVIVVNSPTTCVGSTFTLTATGGTAYAWSGPNAYVSALQNPPFASASTSLSGNYTVVVTSAQGCTSSAVANLLVVTLPTVTIVGTNTLCSQNFNASPNTVVLTAGGATTFTWTLPAGYSANPNLNSANITLTPSITAVQNITTVSVIGSAGSCTSSAVFNLTVNPNPTITVTSASMCAGNSVTLTANNASTYTWTPAASLNTANGPVVIASPSVTTVYSIIGSSVGCNSQTQNATASVVPNPTVTIVPGNPVICLGNSINLTASGATIYTWTPSTALTTTNTANTTASPTITTTYSVLGSQATCTNLATITVTVSGLPSVTVTASSPTLCMNNFNASPNTVSLTAGGATSYTWGPIIGLTTNTINGATIIGTSDGSSAIGTGTVIGANGTCTNSATFTVNAIPNPIIAVTSGSMCAGTSVVLTANNATTYTWTPGASLNMTSGPSVIASPSVTTMYSVIGSSVGCNSQTQNGTASVVANPTVTIAPLTPTICFGNSIGLTASGATNYTWSPNTAITATIGANVTVNPTVTTMYTIIGEQATCTNVATSIVTVIALPVININLNTPNICMNNFNGSTNTVNINASGATTYTWTGFTGLNANTTSGAFVVGTAIPNAAIGSGTVVGFVGTCSNVASFSVVAIPNPTISVPSESMCAGTSVVLNASGADTYVWAPSNSLSSPFGSSVIASPSVTTIYGIVGTSLNCNSTTELSTVTIVANPVVVVSPVTPTICAGSQIGLTAFGATDYTWTPGASLNTNTGNVVIASPMVTTDYTVIGSQATCTNSTVRQVLVIPLPQLQAICERTAICIGDQTIINANGANSYTWTPSNSLTSATSNFVIANPLVSTMYTLIGTNGLCTATLSVPIEVIAKPVLNLTTTNPRICIGQSAVIFASGAQAYSWTPTGNANITNTTMATVSPSVSTNYTVTGYNFSGTTACPFTKEILIEIVPQVTATINNSVAICEGESVKLSAGGSNTYIWAPATGLNNSLTASPYANPKTTTVYTVQISNGGFCGTTATVLVKVNPQPTVDAGPDLSFNVDEPMYLNARGTGTLTWIFGEGILCKDCPNTQIMPTGSSAYKIQAVNSYGCKATDDVNVEVTKDYSIYIPNIFTPNYDGLNDVFLVYGTGITQLEMFIFDRWGTKLYTSTDQLKGWDGVYAGELSKNDVYVYLVNFTTLDGKTHTKTGHVTLMK